MAEKKWTAERVNKAFDDELDKLTKQKPDLMGKLRELGRKIRR